MLNRAARMRTTRLLTGVALHAGVVLLVGLHAPGCVGLARGAGERRQPIVVSPVNNLLAPPPNLSP